MSSLVYQFRITCPLSNRVISVIANVSEANISKYTVYVAYYCRPVLQ